MEKNKMKLENKGKVQSNSTIGTVASDGLRTAQHTLKYTWTRNSNANKYANNDGNQKDDDNARNRNVDHDINSFV